ncbi:polysaccharide deacetylase family protein, partial [Patulibacter sp. S7RM1-6]
MTSPTSPSAARPEERPAGRALHLTFDDGPCPVWTPRVLEALAAHDARATFFVLGSAARRAPELVSATLAAGHRVELHADAHVRHSARTRAEIADDADRALATLAALDVAPRWWRTPWGVATDDTRAVAADRGLELVRWGADTHDWRGDAPETMLAAVARDVPDGGVVLAHDALGPGARRAGCAATVALVGLVAAWARERGL